jgi:hypothetical protein
MTHSSILTIAPPVKVVEVLCMKGVRWGVDTGCQNGFC